MTLDRSRPFTPGRSLRPFGFRVSASPRPVWVSYGRSSGRREFR